MFVAESNVLEAIRSNQKLYELKPKYTPTVVAACGSIVAVGGDDQKVRLHEWDGKALKEIATLENNKGSISALAFSPDGSLLVAGDVSDASLSLEPVVTNRSCSQLEKWCFTMRRSAK